MRSLIPWRGRRNGQPVDLAAELVDVVAGDLELLGEFPGIARRGVAVGGGHPHLGVEPRK